MQPDMFSRDSRQKQGILALSAKHEIIAQGELLQKRDIVDTKTHASCISCQYRDKQSFEPIM